MTAKRPNIISRLAWAAQPVVTPAGSISVPSAELWLHHTAGEQFGAAGMRMLQAFTLHRTDVRYVDLEYSFVVDHVSCDIFESRGPGKNTAATGGRVRRLGLPIGPSHNSISHAICVMGNFEIDDPSEKLLATLANLVAWGHEQGWWPLGFTGGHRDASGNSTACPGNKLEARIESINAFAVAIHASTGPPQEDDDVPKPTDIVDSLTNKWGRWQLTADGGVRTKDGKFYGSYPGLKPKLRQGDRFPFLSIDSRPDGREGYMVTGADGAEYKFGPDLMDQLA